MTTLLMENVREEFGAAVRDLLDGRSLSLRQARTRTGVDIDTLSRMRGGEVVRMDKVIQFARGFGLDANDWLELAGYGRLDGVGEGGGVSEERRPLSNRDRLGQWVLEMGELYPLAAAELQVALRHGLEQLHTASDAEFAVMLEEDRERIRRVHEAAARAAGTEERG